MTAPLPEGSLLLHIGPQKTGSTALQSSMHGGRAELAAQGVCYPGTTMRPQAAGWALMDTAAIGRPKPSMKAWEDLVAEVRATTLPRTCVSNEDFGRADEATIARILDGLGTENTHLVFVARRLDKLLPSHWQERVKAKMTLSYDEFLHHVLDTPTIDWEARVTWEPHDVALVLDRWAKHLPREQITVIASDEADRTLIPRTFESMLALAPGTLKTPTINTNTSLTFTQTEAVRRLNRMAIDRQWTPQQYWRIIQGGVVKALRQADAESTPATRGPQITGLPGWAYPMVAERAHAQVAAIEAAGVNLVGDPARLLLEGNVEPAELPENPDTVPIDLIADLVAGAVDGTESLHRRELRNALRSTASAGGAGQLSGRDLVKMLGGKVGRRLRRG